VPLPLLRELLWVGGLLLQAWGLRQERSLPAGLRKASIAMQSDRQFGVSFHSPKVLNEGLDIPTGQLLADDKSKDLAPPV
jgi:hypothetical protein